MAMSMSQLPRDLVEEEILCRVPALSLRRLRSTCKRWNRLFKDSRFARNHFEKAKKKSFVLMLTKEFRIFSLNVHLRGSHLPSLKVSLAYSISSVLLIQLYSIYLKCFTVMACCYVPSNNRLESWFGTPVLAKPSGTNRDIHTGKATPIVLDPTKTVTAAILATRAL